MDEKEEDFYQALYTQVFPPRIQYNTYIHNHLYNTHIYTYTQSQAQFNTYLLSGTVLNNYAHIFDILIRLRQAVDHPYLVIYSDTQSTSEVRR